MIDRILNQVTSAMEWKATQANERFYSHRRKDPPKTNRQAIIRMSRELQDAKDAIKEDEGFFAKWLGEIVKALGNSPTRDELIKSDRRLAASVVDIPGATL